MITLTALSNVKEFNIVSELQRHHEYTTDVVILDLEEEYFVTFGALGGQYSGRVGKVSRFCVPMFGLDDEGGLNRFLSDLKESLPNNLWRVFYCPKYNKVGTVCLSSKDIKE